uniref:Neurotransmitter-gated ion-channel ligand-binding domain-containing protein n=1 Tax=Trichobilharzia regenti TaxID=157069 RepID=A0AA85JMJ9_TRIRE|nr:unnamed protein product [Trichobilharzia regenti]
MVDIEKTSPQIKQNTLTPFQHDKGQIGSEFPRQISRKAVPKIRLDSPTTNQISPVKKATTTAIASLPNVKKKRKSSRKLFSIRQTESLIKALEYLTNSIEKNNWNLEMEFKEREKNPLNLDHRRTLQPQHDSVNSRRTSSLTGKNSRPRNYNTKYGASNRHEHRRKSITLKHIDESAQNRTEKVAVEVRVVFLKIGEIDTLKELYYADAFLQAKWREPRLDGHTAEELSITELEQYWNPLLYIDNILSETKETQWIMAVRSESGEVYLIERRRIKGVFLETLELNDFPLDVQDLTITVTTERPDTEVDIIPDQVEMSAINIQTFVDQQEWKLHEHVEIKKRIIKQEYSSSMKSHPCLSVTCRAARRPGYFYWNVFLIMFMISGLAFATFAVSPDKAELRLRLSFTLILTSVTFKYVITQSLPKISYLTYMDKYVLMSLFICALSVLSDTQSTATPLPTSASVNTTYPGPRIVFPYMNAPPSSISLSSSPSTNSEFNSTSDRYPMNISNYDPVNKFPSTDTINTSNGLQPNYNSSSITSPVSLSQNSTSSMYNQIQNDSTPSLAAVNQTFSSLLREQNSGCSRSNRIACSDWKMVQQIEQHVFTSFVTIYILAHAIFIFWLYFDASRRRREMRQKDKDYRVTKQPINQDFHNGEFVCISSDLKKMLK